jgi:hypothetical protein
MRKTARLWQAELVDPWTIGLTVVIILGLAAIIYGALSDRRKNRRAAAEMLAPPKRDIPRFRPNAESPHYLSDLQARRPPADAGPSELTQTERQQIKRQLDQPSVTKINSGYASKDFVTDHGSSWAVLDHPRLLLCEDPVDSVRELLPILEKLILTKTPLVIIAPHLDPEVVRTLEVNKIQGTMKLLAVHNVPGTELASLATSCGAVPVDRTARQSGHAGLDQLGQCDRWVSSRDASYVITNASAVREAAEPTT